MAGVWNEAAGFTFEDMQDAIKDVKVGIPKELNIVIEIDHHDHLTELLWNRKWQMLVAAEGSGGFVTTDDPVLLRWTDGQTHGGLSPGFAVQGTEVIFPISPTLALRGSFEAEENVIDADAATVGTLNSLTSATLKTKSTPMIILSSSCAENRPNLEVGRHLSRTSNFWKLGNNPKMGRSSRYGPNKWEARALKLID